MYPVPADVVLCERHDECGFTVRTLYVHRRSHSPEERHQLMIIRDWDCLGLCAYEVHLFTIVNVWLALTTEAAAAIANRRLFVDIMSGFRRGGLRR